MKENLLASTQALVLAAGKSTRFAMGSSKLAFPLCGQEMILYPVSILQALSVPTIVVTGYQKEIITQLINDHGKTSISFIEQLEQRGTGHAVKCTQELWQAENLLIINGDMPLITPELIQQLISEHIQTEATISFVVAKCTEFPNGYGKVIKKGHHIGIVEARDFIGTQQEGELINAGIYLIKKNFLQDSLETLTMHENSQEWYITDLISIACTQNKKVHTIETDFDTVRGINTVEELTLAEKIIREKIIKKLMLQGVYFEHPETTLVEQKVSVGPGTRIGAGVQLKNGTTIGARCTIGNYSIISQSILADQIIVLSHCVITQSDIHDHATIGPFAHLRNVHSINERVTIGNFVEVSSSTIGAGSKAKHLSYIGNATIGEKVNIGAGTITCNYDGIRKNITTIENNVHIGSNNCLIAPVTIGHDAMTAAGSVITSDVPPYALGIARAHQVNKEQYAQRLSESRSFIGATKTDSSQSTNDAQ